MSPTLSAAPTTLLLWALSLGLLLAATLAWLWRRRRMQGAQQHLHDLLLAQLPGFAYRWAPGAPRGGRHIGGPVQALTGWSATDLLAAPALLDPLAHPDERARVAAEREQAVSARQCWTLEYRALRRDGSAFWVREHGAPVHDARGRLQWLEGVVLDISAHKSMDTALCAARAQAEEARLAKTVFLANVGHELRTPLNAIIGFSEVVLRGELEPEQRPHVFKVRQSARALLRQLNDILALARLERGPVPCERGALSLRELAHELLAAQRPAAERKGLDLRLELAAGLPEQHQGDAQRLRQVLEQLLDNAIKFTEQGWVLLRIAADGGDVLLTVQDSGIGIAAERQARIFEPFTQAEGGASRRFNGAGVGTTLALRLVEHMGGSLQLHSTPGQGSSFIVRLPLPALAAPPPEPPAARAPAPASAPLAPAAASAALAAASIELPPPWAASLRQAIEALRGGDHSDATLPSLLQGLRGHGLHQQATQIEQALALFDLDRAAELLETLPGPLLP